MIDIFTTDLRARLVAIALAALERGEAIGLRAVARDAGVSAMAPYRHFRDKDALLAAVALQGFETLRGELLAADQQPSALEALIAQGEAYVAFARRHPKLFRLMFAGHDGGPPPVEDNAYGVMVRRVRQIAPENLEAATLACWSAVHGIATLALDGGLPTAGSPYERAALVLIIRGLSKDGAIERGDSGKR
jgi:AcrR family transcriptional regulator